MIDDDHCIVSEHGVEHYVPILSIVDKDLLEPNASVICQGSHGSNHSVVGVLNDDEDATVAVMKVESAPTETYASIGGLED